MRGNLLLTGIVWLLLASFAHAALPDGQHIFSTTCAACHGLDGHGGEHAPDIAGAAKIRALSDQELSHVVDNGIPAAGMPAFGTSLKAREIDAVIGYLRTLQNQQKQTALSGDPARGHQLFLANASCSSCHLMNGEGGFIGPELSSYGKTHNDTEIRQAILQPDKSFDTRHAMTEVKTRQGSVLKGIIRNEDNFSLQIQSLDGGFHLLNKSDVLAVKRANQSLMPGNYGTKLSKTDLDDLIAYLITAASGKPSQTGDEDDN